LIEKGLVKVKQEEIEFIKKSKVELEEFQNKINNETILKHKGIIDGIINNYIKLI
jgi:hypothetical protein